MLLIKSNKMSSLISFPDFSDFIAILSLRSLTSRGSERRSNAVMEYVQEEILGSEDSHLVFSFPSFTQF